jgi:hypothetical protein
MGSPNIRFALVIVAFAAACGHQDSTVGSASGAGSGSMTAAAAPPADAPTFELASVAGNGLEPVAADAFTVTVSESAVTVLGKTVVPLKDGDFDAADKQGESDDVHVPKLHNRYAAEVGTQRDATVVAFDRRTQMRVVDEVLASLDPRAPNTKVRLAVRAPDTVAALVLTYHGSGYVPEKRNAKTYHPIVAITRHRIELGSTQSEAQEPVSRDELVGKLRDAMAKHRDKGHEVLVRYAGDVTLERVAPLLAGMREVYPDVMLWWSGFERSEEAEQERQVAAFADLLTAEGSGRDEGDMSKRKPGPNLADQIAELRAGDAKVSLDSIQDVDKTSRTSGGVVKKLRAAYLDKLAGCAHTIPAAASVKVTITILRDGTIGSPIVDGNAGLAKCVKDQIATWDFGPSDAAAQFVLGVTLRP